MLCLLILSVIFPIVTCSSFTLDIHGRRNANGASTTHRRAAAIGSNLTSYELFDFTTEIGIGTPPQQFIVQLALDVAYVWVVDDSCPYGSEYSCDQFCDQAEYCDAVCIPSCCSTHPKKPMDHRRDNCASRKRFNSTASTTYKPTNLPYVPTDYPDFSPVYSALIAQDTITLGDKQSERGNTSIYFAQATSTHLLYGESLLDSTQAYDGVLGVGLSVSAACSGQAAVTSPLKSAYMAKQLPQSITTWWLQQCETDNDDDCWPHSYHISKQGRLTVGDVDTQNCDSTWHKHKSAVTPRLSCTYHINMQAVSIGKLRLTPATPWTVEFAHGFMADGFRSVMYGPKSLMDKIVIELGGDTSTYRVACSATNPPLVLTLDNITYTISSEALVHRSDSDTGTCRINLETGSDSIVFGIPLFRAYCHSFDFLTGDVSFAKNIGPKAKRFDTYSSPATAPAVTTTHSVAPRSSLPAGLFSFLPLTWTIMRCCLL